MKNAHDNLALEAHGPGRTYYNRLASADKLAGSPVMGCMCGWLPADVADNWEAAGKMLDEHIRGALSRQMVAYAEQRTKEKSKKAAAK